jgi:hypothetical protein
VRHRQSIALALAREGAKVINDVGWVIDIAAAPKIRRWRVREIRRSAAKQHPP